MEPYINQLIRDTQDGTASWEFIWGLQTAIGYPFPMFKGHREGTDLRLIPELGIKPGQDMFAIMCHSGDKTFFSDTEEFPMEQGMDLWIAVEENCTNKQVFLDEMQKRKDAVARGEGYPQVTPVKEKKE